MSRLKYQTQVLLSELHQFNRSFFLFVKKALHIQFLKFEAGKTVFATALYRKRGRLAKRFIHSGMAGITALGIIIAPVVADELGSHRLNPWDAASPSQVLSASAQASELGTDFSDKGYRDQTIEYTVAEGDTVSSIAKKFDISEDTIRWQNDLESKHAIKVGQKLQILPVTGISHKVAKGDTIYSISKKYDADPQAIVDFPFNTFVNDETFELAIGQIVIVPEGIKKDDLSPSSTPRTKQITPDAGTVVASGNFVWPTQGTITQKFYWYHPGVDIANRAAPTVVAADSGKVISAGWDNTGYGNMVMIDHGNGYKTRYGHLQKIYVTVGQSVGRGSAIGQMGSTGHSTGTHLHFEIYKGGTRISPLGVLK